MTPISKIEAAARAATQGEWKYRQLEYDDWGYIRSEDGYIVAVARAGGPVIEDDHRARKTDPYGPNAKHIATSNPATIIALCEDLMACMDALCAADATMPYDGHINGMARSVVSSALQNLKKWGL